MKIYLSRGIIMLQLLFLVLICQAQNIYYVRQQNPWGQDLSSFLTQAYGAGNYTITDYSINPATLLTNSTSIIYLEGSDQTNPASLSSFLTSNHSMLEQWVQNGGKLFLNAAPNQGGNMSFGFGGITLEYRTSSPNYTWSSTAYITSGQLSHLIFNSPASVGTSWTGSFFGHAIITGAGFTSLITGDLYNQPGITGTVLAELKYGSGLVLFGGLTTPNFHGPQPQANNLFVNILSYLKTFVGNTIIVNSVSNPLCQGSTISVPYTITGTYNAGNTFTAQLSDALGSFSSTTVIGNVSATTSGSISATIPVNAQQGTGYRIRVVSSDPAIIGSDNGSNIVINELPSVNCPSNITIDAEEGQCGANVSFAATGSGTISYSNAPGSFFPVGTTTVTVTSTTDCGSSSCSFTVTVKDKQPPIINNCPPDITIDNTPGNCSAVVNWTAPTATDNCGGTLNNLIQNGGFETGNLNGWTISNLGTAGFCPSAPRDWNVLNSNSTGCTDVGSPVYGNYAVYNMFDGPYALTYRMYQTVTLPSTISSATLGYKYTVSWSFSGLPRVLKVRVYDQANTTLLATLDQHSYTGSGSQGWTSVNVDVASLIAPYAGQNVIIDFSVEIPQAWTGPAGLAVDDISLNISNNSVTLISDHAPGSVFPVGSTLVTYKATDQAGNSSSCSFKVIVKDHEAPTITCPNPKTIGCDASSLPANTGTATAADNCDLNPVISYTDVSTQDPDVNHAGHYNYIITRTWKATDNANNSSTCNQTITVQDVTSPTAKCKSIEVYLGLDGTVSITGAQADDGSSDNCSPVTLGVSPNSFNTSNVGSNNVTLTVTDVSGNSSTCQTTVTVKKRPTTLVYTGDGSEQYSDQQLLTAVLKDQLTNSILSSKLISFTIGTQSTSGTTDVSGTATANLILTQDPAPAYTVQSNFAGDDTFLPSSDEDGFDILQEDAKVYYSGALFASTSGTNSSLATVTLSATIKDISAVIGDPAYDVFKGDIRNATVTFINRDNNTVLASNVPVGLVNVSDLTVGTATKNVTLDISAADAKQFTIGIVVSNYYTRNSSADNTIVTVSKPLDNFITGGGYIVLTDKSAGQKAGTQGTNNNFGFNVKYNKNGTNLQGNMNTIIRRMEGDGILHVYQIKGNSMTSLAVNSSVSTAKTATFNGKASIQDITDPTAPQSIDGNATLLVTITDRGEPGNTDDIGITVWNKSGGLWYSSNWNGTKTVNQTLAGGNLKVNGANYNAASANTATLKVAQESMNIVPQKLELTVFPNPAVHSFTVSLKSSTAEKIAVRVIDILGRAIEVKENLSAGATIKLGENYRPGTYIIEATQGSKKEKVKVSKLPD